MRLVGTCLTEGSPTSPSVPGHSNAGEISPLVRVMFERLDYWDAADAYAELDCHTSQWDYPLTPLSGSLTTWKVEALLVLRILPVLAPRPVAFTAYMRSRSILPFWKLSFDLLLQYALYGVVYEPIHCPPAQPVCQSCQPSCPVVLTARPYFGAQRRGTP